MVRKIALIDMDNTLADYEKSMAVEFDKLTEGFLEPSYDALRVMYGDGDDWPAHLWNRIESVWAQVDWWRNLEQLPVGFEIMNFLKEQLGYEIHIVTSGPSRHPRAWMEKFAWAQEHVPGATVHVTKDKSIFHGDILVDDWPSFVEPWMEMNPGGLVIMPAFHYNRRVDHPNVLRHELGEVDALAGWLLRKL